MDRSAEEIVRSLGRLKVMPMVAQRVMEVLREPDKLSAQALAAHIAHDPALCAQILREANSAFYYAGREVKDLLGAIVVLGFARASELVLATSLSSAFGSPSDVRARFAWRHGLLVATVASRLARAGLGGGSDVLFVAGLMHDLGRSVFREAFPDIERAAFEEQDEREAYALCKYACGVDPSDLALSLATIWKLPAEARYVMARHHDLGSLFDKNATRDERLSLLLVMIGKVLADGGLALRERGQALKEAMNLASALPAERQLCERLPKAIQALDLELAQALERGASGGMVPGMMVRPLANPLGAAQMR